MFGLYRSTVDGTLPYTRTMPRRLEQLTAGQEIVFGGDRVTTVPSELAEAFRPGDRLVVVQDTGALLHIPATEWAIAAEAIERASRAFLEMGSVSDQAITSFYRAFAARLSDDSSFGPIATANRSDLERARDLGRSTTRLELSERMRADMISGLEAWAAGSAGRGTVVERIEHTGWEVELVKAGLGVVAFVFEGRPNVFADATGVLRSGNTVVFRIGSDALGTAQAIVTHALDPALEEAGLPPGAVSLIESRSRAAGWAAFSNERLALAVARGSGAAVAQLGAVARQAGVPVSLHGTGGAWIVADTAADAEAFEAAVAASLDRKVCNTLNTCCIVRSRADELVPRFLDGLRQAAEGRGANPKLHVIEGEEHRIPGSWFDEAPIDRAEGAVREPMAEPIAPDRLGDEWEWENSPEVTLAIVDDLDDAIDRFNAQSPRFVISLISSDPAAHRRIFDRADAPFVGNGFTRWVDGQYALDRPELGLSNWEFGRLFGRGAILSGDSVFTLRTRAKQADEFLKR